MTVALVNDSGQQRAKYLVGLIFLAAISTVGYWMLAARGAAVPMGADALWDLTYRLFLVAWVRADGRIHGFSAPYEFDAFLFFGWPVALPYYLCKTRGFRGLLAAFGMWVLLLLPPTIWEIVHAFKTMR